MEANPLERTNGDEDSSSFYKRFSIDINLEQEIGHFINRCLNLVEIHFDFIRQHQALRNAQQEKMLQLIATELSIRYGTTQYFKDYVDNDFIRLLRALESLYKVLKQLGQREEKVVDELVKEALSKCEVDLGIRWRKGVFIKEGAKLLDEKLIDEPYHWLSSPIYINVLTPFKKGMTDFLTSTNKPERLKDVVRDMYVALEKMARIVCNNSNNLGANTHQFVKKLQLSPYYEDMLRKHTEYAHTFRHANEGDSEAQIPQPQEVEAFVYMTGLFIRLAIQCLNNK